MGLTIFRSDANVKNEISSVPTPQATAFVLPTVAAVSSSANGTQATSPAATTNDFISLFSTSNIRAGGKYTGTALYGKKLQRIDTYFYAKVGSPTGPVAMTVRKVADDSVVATSASIDASTITANGYYTFTFSSEPILPAENMYFLAEFNQGTSTNYIKLGRRTTAEHPDFTQVTYTTFYSESPSADVTMNIITYTDHLSFLNDGSNTTFWKSNTESNPYAIVDLGSQYNIAGVRIEFNQTGRPQNYDVDASEDNVTYKHATNVSSGIVQGQNQVNFPIQTGRYVRIQANETIALEIAEITVYRGTAEQFLALHGHGQTVN
jgi:hypothetical protein